MGGQDMGQGKGFQGGHMIGHNNARSGQVGKGPGVFNAKTQSRGFSPTDKGQAVLGPLFYGVALAGTPGCATNNAQNSGVKI